MVAGAGIRQWNAGAGEQWNTRTVGRTPPPVVPLARGDERGRGVGCRKRRDKETCAFASHPILAGIAGNRWLSLIAGITNPASLTARAIARKQSQNIRAFRTEVTTIRDRLKALCRSHRLRGRLLIYHTSRPILYTAYRFDSIIVYAPLPIATAYRARIPSLILRRPGRQQRGLAAFVFQDIAALFGHENTHLIFDSRQ